MEKRHRSNEIEKRQIDKDIDKKKEEKYSDHEDLLERKRNAMNDAQNQAAAIKKRLAERKKKMAEA